MASNFSFEFRSSCPTNMLETKDFYGNFEEVLLIHRTHLDNNQAFVLHIMIILRNLARQELNQLSARLIAGQRAAWIVRQEV